MENISYKIMKIIENDNSTIFEASCSCCHPDHSLQLVIEKDKDISLQIYTNTYYYEEYDKNNFFLKLYKRIKNAIKLIFTGSLKIESDFLFSNKKQIEQFIEAIQKTKEKYE